MQLSVLLVLVAFIGRSGASGSWGYGRTHGKVYGPKDWGRLYKNCDGTKQSPVNIVTRPCDDADVDEKENNPKHHRMLSLTFAKEDGDTTGSMTNNGHSPTFAVKTGGATFKNPINRQTYKLAQFHLHFGCDDSVGSEHTVNGKPYPGEMHMVFFNIKYGNAGTASTKSDGLSVIGVFLKKAKLGISSELRNLATKLPDITAEGTTTEDFNVKLANLNPDDLASGTLNYYSYKGSLTTPGCYESVSWFVLGKHIKASQSILKQFRKLEAEHGFQPGKMCNNFRPTQPLNGRKIVFHRDF